MCRTLWTQTQCTFLVDDHNTHRTGGAGHHAHRGLNGSGVQIGHLQLGDFANLSLGDLRNLILVGLAGRMLNAAGLLDQNGSGRRLGLCNHLQE